MAAICDAAIHLCAVRVTRLDALGNATAGPNNVYITDKPMMLTAKPEIEAGQDKTLVGGCDCIIARYRGYDKLKRFSLELDLGVLEPGLIEMLTGASAILETPTGFPIGLNWPNQANCSAPVQPNVAVEAWQDLWEDDHQAASYQYVHWTWPSSFWQIADHTLQNDFLQPKLTGFTRGNPLWGLGIFHDQPSAVGQMGNWVFTNTRPVARCGYQTFPLT